MVSTALFLCAFLPNLADDREVFGNEGTRRDFIQLADIIVNWCKIRQRRGDQGIKGFDDEICLLEIIDPVARAQCPLQVEANTMGRGVVQE